MESSTIEQWTVLMFASFVLQGPAALFHICRFVVLRLLITFQICPPHVIHLNMKLKINLRTCNLLLVFYIFFYRMSLN